MKKALEILVGLGILWGAISLLVSPAPAQAPVIQGPFFYNHQTSTTTGVTLKAGPGTLHCITLNTPVATGVVTVYDNTTASGSNVIAVFTVAASPQPSTTCYDVQFGTGLSLKVATAGQDLTVSYR